MGENLKVGRVVMFATFGGMLAGGVANMVFGWPVWEAWVERGAGFLLLAGLAWALWMELTPRGRIFDGSALLEIYRSRGGIEGVERFLGRLGKNAKHGSEYYLLGNLLDGLGDGAGADAAYRRSAGFGHGPAMSVLGRAHFARGDYEGAEQWFRQARDAGVKDVEAHLAEAARRREVTADLD